jgi:hypothetical protein
MTEPSEQVFCPACGSPLQPGLTECPICGTALEIPIIEKILAPVDEPSPQETPVASIDEVSLQSRPKLDPEEVLPEDVNAFPSVEVPKNSAEKQAAPKAARKRHRSKKAQNNPVLPQVAASPVEPILEILADASRFEQANDLSAALEAYRRALALAEVRRNADPAFELTIQTLASLIQRTEQLLAKPTISMDVPAATPAEPASDVVAVHPAKPAVEPERILPKEAQEVSQPTPLPALEGYGGGASHQEPGKQLLRLADTPPVPIKSARPKIQRSRRFFITLVGIILLGIFCLVLGVMSMGGDLTKLSFFSTLTPTPTSTNTSTPTATFTPTPDWAVKIEDAFDSNKNSWPIIDSASYSCGVENMHIQYGKLMWNMAASQNCFWYELPKTGVFGDFSFFIDVQRTFGPEDNDFGVVFHELNGQYYYFGITDSYQQYAVSIYQNNTWTDWIFWTYSTAIRPNAVNRIGIVARGSEYQFFINGVMVADKSDTSLPSGEIGVAAEARDPGTELRLEWDNLELNWDPYVQSNP